METSYISINLAIKGDGEEEVKRRFTTVRPRRPTTLVVGGIGQFRFVDSYLYS